MMRFRAQLGLKVRSSDMETAFPGMISGLFATAAAPKWSI